MHPLSGLGLTGPEGGEKLNAGDGAENCVRFVQIAVGIPAEEPKGIEGLLMPPWRMIGGMRRSPSFSGLPMVGLAHWPCRAQ
jgi:hypothetical protein